MDIGLQKNINIGLNSKSSIPNNPVVEIVLMVVIGALFFWFIVLPKQSAVGLQKTQMEALNTQESETSANLATLKALITQLNSDKQDVNYLDQAIPLSGNTIDLQLLVQHLADMSQVTVGSLSVTGGGTGAVAGNKILLSNPYGAARTLQKLSGTVVVQGTFIQLKTFLQTLETSGRILDISSLSIDPGSQGNLNLRVVFSAYYLAP